jgi:lysophospholipase
MLTTILLMALFLLPLLALCLSEERLLRNGAEAVRPFFENELVAGTMIGADGVPLSFRMHEPAESAGALVLLGGRTESQVKYAELLLDLAPAGYTLYILDHRGQGFSGRLLADPHKGHVERFEDYVEDLDGFMRRAVRPERHARTVLLAHSMGGAIAVLYAAEHAVDGLILSAPMLSVRTAPLPRPAAVALASGLTALGLGRSYVPGGGPYNPADPFEGNVLTGSRVRFELNQRLVERYPETALGGPTNRWADEAFRACRRAIKAARLITVPILLPEAGEDQVVSPAGLQALKDAAPQAKRLVLAGARHELLMERDEIRDQALAAIRTFLDRPV